MPVVGAPSGTYSEPLMTPSMIPPPSVLCRKISSGSAGKVAGSLAIVSCEPTAIAITEAKSPTRGPAIEKSNIACLFLGGSLNVVTVLVVPVIKDGTNVGTEIFIYSE